jgi:hypothetical protein
MESRIESMVVVSDPYQGCFLFGGHTISPPAKNISEM